MLFTDIKTEKDLDKLKRRIATDAVLYARILELRRTIPARQNKPASIGQNELNIGVPGQNSGPKMPTNA